MIEIDRCAFELFGVDVSQPRLRMIHTVPPVGDQPSKNHASTGALLSADASVCDGRGSACTTTAGSQGHSRSIQVEPDPHLSRLAFLAGGVHGTRTEDCRVCRAAGDAGEGSGAAARRHEAVRRHRTAYLQGVVFRGAEVRQGYARETVLCDAATDPASV